MMNVKICNLQGVTDTLFREFMSQPGERQWCSELLHSIIRGECVETKDLLKVPLDPSSSIKGSPRGSPLNSPRNQANLSPLLLPPSPRFSSSPNLNTLTPSPSARSPHTNLTNTNLRFDPNESHPNTPPNATGQKIYFRRRENTSLSPPSPPILPVVSRPSGNNLQEFKNQVARPRGVPSSTNASPNFISSPKEESQNALLIKEKSEAISPSIISSIVKPQVPLKQISPLHSPAKQHINDHKKLFIPKFYFPNGRPPSKSTQESIISQIDKVFLEHGGQITLENMEPLTKACQVPVYWKCPLFLAAGGEHEGCLSHEQFTTYWIRMTSRCHDAASQFVSILCSGQRNYLLAEDFFAFVQDVVDTHPGLSFLREAQEFHSRYVHTVIARIYYCVNRTWSGKISLPELRRSNLLQIIQSLEEEEDINQITEYFSYEHFYVIYCKFWELDTDHDLFIDKNDLAKHNERALSFRMIERIFSGAVTRGQLQKQDLRMGYQEFVWFLISEEDKKHPAAIEYWFRCMDLDGDGFISMYELEYFYEEQLQRMEALGIETLPFTDCLCQILDMVQPEAENVISLRDLKGCRMTTMVFDILFNLEKYLDHEQRDPFSSQRMDEEESMMSDWDRYAAEEYEFLVAEESGGDQPDDIMYGEDEEVGVEDILDGGTNDVAEVNGYNLHKQSSTMPSTVTSLTHDLMDNDHHYNNIDDSEDFY